MADSLFRKEALEARRSRWLGGIVLGQPLGPWLLTAFAVFVATAIVLFLAFGDYARRSRVAGQLVPSLGVASVMAPTSGTLAQVHAEEGQLVQAGDVLAVLSSPRATLARGNTDQALQATIAVRQDSVVESYVSQRQQIQAQSAGLAEQQDGVRSELRLIQAELATRRQQQQLAEQTMDRYRGLREKQYVTALQLQQQQSIVLENVGAVQALERQVPGLRRQLSQLQQARSELPSRLAALDAAEQGERATLSQQSVEAHARAESVIVAPVTGTVSTLLGQVGQAMQPGQPVLSLLPAGSRLEAHLLVPSRAVGFIEPGDTVLLRYQAFPYQKFGHHSGRVARISRSTINPGELGSISNAGQPGEPYYRIVVALDEPTVRAFGKDEPLKPGMLLEADILGEKRRLWEWALEPVYALGNNLGAN
ncbi:MAG: HlyD family efflux transporter periplasmic adaptor subunit [Arenimonas sp.]|uniref:HlyD family secretion protein n=1 Tax=Arenimonas sp. TaxID=1872635 RepID=UPI0025C4BCAB|nr:HlyD family efflux transporter periplasmic adaptor subunit [Arenimonas sp.]MBW8366521.1 HlyD family efflux transporter periplasmic adaptor subunit [Arenimonas sp.]